MNNDLELARRYALHQSEEAFETLISRHVGLVYSAAVRQVLDAHLAEEITQTVFIILARKAGSLSSKTILSGWLYRTTHYVASAAMKMQRRRERREEEAQMQATQSETDSTWEQLAPILDQAMAHLREKDRDAIVLRYFENKSLRDVGAAFGVNEYAAQKRVARGLEKLRAIFAKHGVHSTTAIISGAISVNSVQIAPAGWVKTISAVALTNGAATSTSTLTFAKGALKIMAWTKAKTAIVAGAVILLAAGTTVLTVTETQNQIRNREIATALLEMHQQWAANDYRAKGMLVPKTLDNGQVTAYSAGILGAYVLYHYQEDGIDWKKRFHILRENTNTTTWSLYEFAEPDDTNLLQRAWQRKLITINGNP